MEINSKKTDPVLILDLGNVVFDLSFEPFEAWLLSTLKQERGDAFSEYWKLYVEYEKSCFSKEEFLSKIRNELGANFTDEEFVTMWATCWVEDTPGLEQWLDKVQPELPVFVLSNTNELHMDLWLEEKNILKRFDHLFLSHELGCRKPEPEIYEKVTQALDQEPSSILFFDDLPENIQGARNAGWQAEVFVGVEESAARLNGHRKASS